MSEPPLLDRYRIPKHVLSKKLGEELVLVDLESGQYYTLNPTGTMVWENLSRFENVAALSQYLSERTAGSVAAIRRDVDDLLRDLLEKKLLLES